MRPMEKPAKHPKSNDEDAINFRPSTNFKYMKYCKGKVELTGAKEEEEGGPSAVNPPLPRGPPPPDSPPLVTPKEEVLEDEYAPDGATDAPEDDGKEKVMCRQFARGACTRGPACIYAHEIIVSQLPGIYTFCRDFQNKNSTCTFPRCKFVHATVFEKEYFYRTGFLPPHALAHLKEPAPALPEGGQTMGPAAFPAPGPAAPVTAAATLVHPGGPASFGGGAVVRPKVEAVGAPAAAPVYRESLERSPLITEPARPEQHANDSPALPEPPAKKCAHCDVTAFKRECQRLRKEQLLRSIREYDRKIAQLDQCNSLQRTLILTVMKHNMSKPGSNLFNTAFNNTNHTTNGSDSPVNTNGNVNHNNDQNPRVKALAERLDRANSVLSGNGGSINLEDNTKKAFAVLMRVLMNPDGNTSPTTDS